MKLTIVVPCYNEEEVLPETVGRLLQVITEIQSKGAINPDSEILLVDDGSKDTTWSLIERLGQENPIIHGLKLSRNRGHQNALLAGLMTADGDAVISIDADLQDDPWVIEKMVAAYHDGYDIVYGVRDNRDSDTAFKRMTAEGYYGLLRLMGVDLVFNHADYRLMTRRAIEALRLYGEVNLFVRGIIPLLGFRSTQVFFRRQERFAGESKYPLHRMLGLAADGITSFSAVPLRLITFLGFVVFVVSTLLGGWALAIRLFSNEAVPGWASTVIPTYFLGGVQLLSIGVIGEYLAKIYMEVKRRPLFHIEKRS
jgi:polyisoprenyl-phosphate glycosyltransferase